MESQEDKKLSAEQQNEYTRFFTPAVIIALITAIAGPLTLTHFENINQKRQLQQQLLGKILDHAATDMEKSSYLDRLAIILAIMEDSKKEFGLDFPTAEKIMEQRGKLLTHELDKRIEDLVKENEKIIIQVNQKDLQVKNLKSDIASQNKRIKEINDQLLSNKIGSKKEQIELEKKKSELEAKIKSKEDDIEKLKDEKKASEEALQNNKILKDRLGTSTDRIKELEQDLNTKNLTIKKQLEEIEKLEKNATTKETSEHCSAVSTSQSQSDIQNINVPSANSTSTLVN